LQNRKEKRKKKKKKKMNKQTSADIGKTFHFLERDNNNISNNNQEEFIIDKEDEDDIYPFITVPPTLRKDEFLQSAEKIEDPQAIIDVFKEIRTPETRHYIYPIMNGGLLRLLVMLNEQDFTIARGTTGNISVSAMDLCSLRVNDAKIPSLVIALKEIPAGLDGHKTVIGLAIFLCYSRQNCKLIFDNFKLQDNTEWYGLTTFTELAPDSFQPHNYSEHVNDPVLKMFERHCLNIYTRDVIRDGNKLKKTRLITDELIAENKLRKIPRGDPMYLALVQYRYAIEHCLSNQSEDTDCKRYTYELIRTDLLMQKAYINALIAELDAFFDKDTFTDEDAKRQLAIINAMID
jgi:hypothetical protein